MKAILRKALADLRRRKVQTAVVMLVVLLSSLAATMALTLLVESDAPFDHAFAQAQGAHLTMSFDASRVTQDQLRATGSITGVTAYAGPWPVSPWAADMGGGLTQLVPLEGRSGPGGPADRLTLNTGRWADTADEVVLAQDFADKSGHQIGDHIQAQSGSLFPAMTVVGIAAGVGDNPAGWTIPTNFPVVTTGKIPTMYDMAYRLSQAGTTSQINAVANAITAELPGGAVVDSNNYLDAKLSADRTTAVMIPFLLAFSGFALLASALIIANLVSGAVIAGTRDIGVMKSVGYTPWQVVLVFAGQMLGPAVIGSVIGLAAGIVASQPFLSDTANAFNLPRTFGVAPLPDALGIGTILVVVALTTLLASWRAGRLSAASAIATGSAPASAHGYRLTRLVSRLPIPRSWSLGAGESF
ncbi:MAG TPA: FtsX-like permease family protein, partial [Candidatus Dormibacteraeota bacterium]